MGPKKAATALVRALLQTDSRLYERYRLVHTKLPAWYQSRFPLRLTHQQRATLILGSTQFFDSDYQKAIVPFLIRYLGTQKVDEQVAACELLETIPEAASPALPTLQRLASSPEPQVSLAAQTAAIRIGSGTVKSPNSVQEF